MAAVHHPHDFKRWSEPFIEEEDYEMITNFDMVTEALNAADNKLAAFNLNGNSFERRLLAEAKRIMADLRGGDHLTLAKIEQSAEEFRRQVNHEKKRLRESEKGLLSKIKKLFTTHKLVIKLERKQNG